MPPRIDDTTRAAIEADIRAGGTCRGIARDHGISPDTVRRIAAEADIEQPFARTNTERATRAKQADNRARRAQLSADLLSDAERLRAQLWEPCTIGAFGGRDNVYSSTDLPEPTPADKRTLLAAVHTAVRNHVDLEKVDATDGADDAASMLSGLLDSIRHQWQNSSTDEPPPEP